MSETIERCFTIRSELGLHARPAGEFVALAVTFESEISVGRGGEWVDGRSVLSLLSLAASNGTQLLIRAIGADAREAIAALGAIRENLPKLAPTIEIIEIETDINDPVFAHKAARTLLAMLSIKS